MSESIALLLGLLLLAYLGSGLVGGRAIRGFGLPSGAEYLVLGFALGPHVLDVVGRSLAQSFEPVALVGTGWLALVIGVGYVRVADRYMAPGRAVAGVVLGVVTCAAVAAIAYYATPYFADFQGFERLALALGMGAVASVTTRHSVRWVVERHGARGPLSDFAADAARASALVPPLGLCLVFVLVPGGALVEVSAPWRALATLLLGVALGFIAALLLGRDFRRDESWGVLLGTGLLVLGAADRLGLSLVAAMFAMGLTLAASRHRLEIKAMLTPTEKPVLLPVTLLAGANLNLELPTGVYGIVVAALLAKVLVRLLLGFVLSRGPARGAGGADFGLSMLAAGGFSMAAALAFAARIEGQLADAVLLFAALATLLGEWLGPSALRRALERSGELSAVSLDETAPPSEAGLSSRELVSRESHG
jgi:hypothetical protein